MAFFFHWLAPVPFNKCISCQNLPRLKGEDDLSRIIRKVDTPINYRINKDNFKATAAVRGQLEETWYLFSAHLEKSWKISKSWN